jgi:DDE family transposase
MSHDTPVLPGLSPVDGLDIHARFDGGALSSDGGVLLLREIERRTGVSDALASCLADRRDAARTRHSYASMIRARVMAIACGYEDCDDMDALRHDPVMKMVSIPEQKGAIRRSKSGPLGVPRLVACAPHEANA